MPDSNSNSLIPRAGDEKMDVLCVGRAGMDLYASETETPFSQIVTFRKSVGGSPANIAVGLARLGRKSALSSKVAKDEVGEFVRDFLQKEGVDVSGVHYALGEFKTSLAITETKSSGAKVILYRNLAADIELSPEDIQEDVISSSRSVVISGTALSKSPSREACFKIMKLAKKYARQVILDLDYRPFGWASVKESSEVYSEAVKLTDILIGNEEEFAILTGVGSQPSTEYASLDNHEEISNEAHLDPAAIAAGFPNCMLVIVKRGSQGCVARFRGETIEVPAFRVKSMKPFGAGDAFAATLVDGLLGMEGEFNLPLAIRRASASAALVVSRFGCAESMPYSSEISDFINSQ